MWKTHRREAYHQAGHAVAALVLGYEVQSMNASEGDERGQTAIPGLHLMEASDRVRTILAGAVAEELVIYSDRMHSRSFEELLRWSGDEMDELSLWPALRTFGGERQAAGVRLLNETDALVRQNWRAIERLARRLEGQYSLSRNEILATFNLSTEPRKVPTNAHQAPKKRNSPPMVFTGRGMTASELRAKSETMATHGFAEAARLMRESADRKEGRRPAGAGGLVVADARR